MPYLRGTKEAKYKPYRPYQKTISEEISSLKRKVALNTGAPYYFRYSLAQNITGANQLHVDAFNLTDTFTSHADYHDHVTGDKFINNNLSLAFTVKAATQHCRLLVYVPKNPTVSYVPTGTNALTLQPDPNSFWILKDVFINHQDTTNDTDRMINLNLRKMITTFNHDAGVIEKGALKMTIITYNGTPSTGQTVIMGVRHSISDK